MSKFKDIVIILLLLLLPLCVKAEECDMNFQNVMLQKVKQINTSYEYMETNNKFILRITNIPNDVKVNESTGYYFINNSNNIYEIHDIEEGNLIQLIYSYSGETCNSFTIKQINFRLPFYNEYWNSEICKGLEEYKYCKRYTTTDIKYDFLKKSIDSYKNKIEEVNVDVKSQSFLTIKDYIIIGSGSLLLLIIIFVMIKNKNRRKVKI